MPQFVANTMRLCTKDAANAQSAGGGPPMYDATVPVKPLYRTGGGGRTTTPIFSESEYCSDSPYDVPWSFDDASNVENPSAMFSVGSVPMWDGAAISTGSKYPGDGYVSQLYNTNPGTSFRTWGGQDGACTDGELLACTTDADCVGNSPGVKVQCHPDYGVCVMDMKQFPSCYAHRDCRNTSQMCSGDGKCVDMTLQVENELDASVEFELYAKDCSAAKSREYDTYGASAWENIPDVMRMYGMCSYHDWFEYMEFVDPSDPARKNQGACTDPAICDPASFNAFSAMWWDTQRPF